MVQNQASEWAVDLHDVHKRYGRKVTALKGIDMQVKPGEIFGLLGPNGAGKSTLVKIMMTVIYPSQAHGTLLGKPIGDKATLKRIGYLPEHHQLPGFLTAEQALKHYAAMSQMNSAEINDAVDKMLHAVGMHDARNMRIKKYSKGMRQRVGIAQAMLHRPDLIVLDEPTDGVDPVGRKAIRELILGMKEQGTTVFINTHLISELEMICDRVAILVKGNVIKQGTVEEISDQRKSYHIMCSAQSYQQFGQVFEGPWKQGSGYQSTTFQGLEIHANGDLLILYTEDELKLQLVIDQLRKHQVPIIGLHDEKPSLEELFMQAVSEQGGG